MSRTTAVVALAIRRVLGRLIGPSRGALFTLVGVALAVALVVTVSGVAFGLASSEVIQSEGVDYWIVPESGDATSLAVSVRSPKLGDAHAVADRLARDDRIDYVTPVSLALIELSNASGGTEYVLAVGVVPSEVPREVLGLSTAGMTPGDPYHANGSYDGPWTGEAVVSDAAAELLGAQTGDDLGVESGAGNRTLTVVAVREGDFTTGVGSVPVVVMHLAELQAIEGATAGDGADQLLVSTDSPGVRADLEGLYPRTTVVARTGLAAGDVSTSSLPLAVALAAFLAALAVGTLFVATTMGLEVIADRRSLATLAAVGYSERTRSLLVLAETTTIATLGGVVGVALGSAGIVATNALARGALGVAPAVFDPILLGYGVGVAVLIGLLGAAYPVWLGRRTDVLEVLRQ